jgi:hypothetical protein
MFFSNEVNLNQKSKIKKLILLQLLLPSKKVNIKSKVPAHKNVFLDSPFHFKTVKTHLHIPVLEYVIELPYSDSSLLPNLLGFTKSKMHSKKVYIII